jgi:Proline racemase
VVIDTEPGPVETVVRLEGDRVREVTLKWTPAFVVQPAQLVKVPEVGEVPLDIAVGAGNVFAIVEAPAVGLAVRPSSPAPASSSSIRTIRCARDSCCEGPLGGILASSITVVDETNEGSLTGRCMLEGRRGQLSEHVLPAGVSDAAARTAIEGKGQIKPTFLGLDGGDVALPELARAIWRRQLCQPVFRDLVTMAAVGGPRPKTALLPGAQAALPHKPGNPVLATAMAQLAQIEPHARAAVRCFGFLQSSEQSRLAARRPLSNADHSACPDARQSRFR